MGIRSFFDKLRGKPKPEKPTLANGHYDPNLRTQNEILDLAATRVKRKQQEIAEGVQGNVGIDVPAARPAQAARPQDIPATQRGGGGATGLAQFHYLRGPEYPVSSWVVSYGLAEHRDSGEIGMIIGLLSGQATGVAGHAGGVGLGRGKRLGGYKPIKGNKIQDFWYPGLGENDYASMDNAGSKGEWMYNRIVSQKQKYQNLATGEWGPKG